jgi:oligopeptide/dipeptide ABC transporter ATP-binding protein
MSDTVLEIKDLVVEFPTKQGTIRAVNRVNIALGKGQRLGLVGESGSGKSMTLLTAIRLTPHLGRIVMGGVKYRGRDLMSLPSETMRSIRGKDIAMIFQDPMTTLNPVYRVGEQVRESLRVHNMVIRSSWLFGEKARRKAERERVLELMAEVGIPSPEERYEAFPHEFSGGMQQRAGIATALACNPAVLLADEPTTALDVTIQAQIMMLLERINRERGTAVILVTHDLSLAAEFCDRIAVMYAGQIVERGDVSSVIDGPKHPYTKGLMNALPRLRFGRQPLRPIPGEVDMANLPPGCAFANRCTFADALCHASTPELETVSPGHDVRCFKAS